MRSSKISQSSYLKLSKRSSSDTFVANTLKTLRDPEFDDLSATVLALKYSNLVHSHMKQSGYNLFNGVNNDGAKMRKRNVYMTLDNRDLNHVQARLAGCTLNTGN